MLSLVGLTSFNVLVLLFPPGPLLDMLELMSLPSGGRLTLLVVVAINVMLSLCFERWGTEGVTACYGWIMGQLRHSKRRIRDGKAYKAVDT